MSDQPTFDSFKQTFVGFGIDVHEHSKTLDIKAPRFTKGEG
jgi:hypothetical protein